MPLVSLGDSVPITYQEPTGSGGYYVQCVVMDPLGAVLASLGLVHVSLGSYILASPYVMPNLQYVLAQYQVFIDPGFTTPSAMHGVVEEKFILAMLQGGGGGGGTSSSSGEILGGVQDHSVVGETSAGYVLGLIELQDDDLAGAVESSDLSGNISESIAIGMTSDLESEGNVD